MAAGASLSAHYAVQRIGIVQYTAELAWQLHAAAFALTMPALGTNFISAALAAHTSRMRHQRNDCSAWPGEACCSPPGRPTSRSMTARRSCLWGHPAPPPDSWGCLQPAYGS